MNQIAKRLDTASLCSGIILIGIGTLFLLDRMNIADFGDVMRDFWPVIIILVGIPQLFRRDKVWSGLWLITLGTWMQLVHLRMFGMSWRSSWPLLLILVGAGMIVRALVEGLARERADERR